VTDSSDAPLVTVGMASFNSARTIRRAVNSVLAQTYSNIELLIFDAASKDETPEILESLAKSDSRIRLTLRDEQRPFVEAFAESLEAARGEFFCLVDADDFISRDWISSLLTKVCGRHYIGAFGTILLIDLEDRLITGLPSSCQSYQFSTTENRILRLLAYVMEPENAGKVNLLYSLWRTESLRQVGAWPSQDERSDDDYLFCLKMLNIGQVAHVNGPWICRTIPAASGNLRIDPNDLPTFSEYVTCSPDLRKWSRWTFPPTKQFSRFASSNRIGWLLALAITVRIALAITALPYRVRTSISGRSRTVIDPK